MARKNSDVLDLQQLSDGSFGSPDYMPTGQIPRIIPELPGKISKRGFGFNRRKLVDEMRGWNPRSSAAVATFLMIVVVLLIMAPFTLLRMHYATGIGSCALPAPAIPAQPPPTGTVKGGTKPPPPVTYGYETIPAKAAQTLQVSRCRLEKTLERTQAAQSGVSTPWESRLNQSFAGLMGGLSRFEDLILILAAISMAHYGLNRHKLKQTRRWVKWVKHKFGRSEADHLQPRHDDVPREYLFLVAPFAMLLIVFMIGFSVSGSGQTNVVKNLNDAKNWIVSTTSGGGHGFDTLSQRIYQTEELQPFEQAIYGDTSATELAADAPHADRYINGQLSPKAEADTYRLKYNAQAATNSGTSMMSSVAKVNRTYTDGEMTAAGLFASGTRFWRGITMYFILWGTFGLIVLCALMPRRALRFFKVWLLLLVPSLIFLTINSLGLTAINHGGLWFTGTTHGGWYDVGSYGFMYAVPFIYLFVSILTASLILTKIARIMQRSEYAPVRFASQAVEALAFYTAPKTVVREIYGRSRLAISSRNQRALPAGKSAGVS